MLRIRYILLGTLAFSPALADGVGAFCGHRCPKGMTTPVQSTVSPKKKNAAAEVEQLIKKAPQVEGQVCPPGQPQSGVKKAGVTIIELPGKKGVPTRGPADSARQIMAMVYGSCDVLNMPVVNTLPAAERSIKPGTVVKVKIGEGKLAGKERHIVNLMGVIKSHPYLEPRLKEGCIDLQACGITKKAGIRVIEDLDDHDAMCKQKACFSLRNPPLYQWGKKSVHGSSLVKVGEHASGLDCSGFIAEALRLSGANFKPNEPAAATGTIPLWALGDGKSCFDNVAAKAGIQPGDILVHQGVGELGEGRHVVMIDTVAEDPFGIQKLRKTPLPDISKDYFASLDTRKSMNIQREVLSRLKVQPDSLKKAGVDKEAPKKADLEAFESMTVEDVITGKDTAHDDATKAAFLYDVIIVACDKLTNDATKFKMTIIHSSNHGELGVQRETLFPGIGPATSNGPMASVMKQKAKVDCVKGLHQEWLDRLKLAQKHFKKSSLHVGLLAEFKDEPAFVKAVESELNALRAPRLMRHNSKKAGCMTPTDQIKRPPELSCVQCCKMDKTYEELAPEGKDLNIHDETEDEEGES